MFFLCFSAFGCFLRYAFIVCLDLLWGQLKPPCGLPFLRIHQSDAEFVKVDELFVLPEEVHLDIAEPRVLCLILDGIRQVFLGLRHELVQHVAMVRNPFY